METSLPKQNDIATHRQMRAHAHELLRRNVVEAAGQLLREEGPDALTVRRVAKQLECSTKIIYTMFKGKDGLAEALYLEGCACLAQTISRVPQASTPGRYLQEVAWAYWAFARAYPSYYMVMFCGAIPNYHPSTTSIRTTTTAFSTVVEMLQQYREQGKLPIDDPVPITKTIQAAVHGVVSLYLLGHFSSFEEAQDVFERTAQAIITSLVP